MKARLATGGEAWFVRRRKGRFCDLKPASKSGHILTGLYIAWIALVSALVVEKEESVSLIVVGVVVMLASTLLYLVTALRMSAPASQTDKGTC